MCVCVCVCVHECVQEELAEYSGQCNSSITGFCSTVDALQYRETRKVDSVSSVHCSSTTDVLCYVCGIQASFVVGNTLEMSAKVKTHLPVLATKVARSHQATRVV